MHLLMSRIAIRGMSSMDTHTAQVVIVLGSAQGGTLQVHFY